MIPLEDTLVYEAMALSSRLLDANMEAQHRQDSDRLMRIWHCSDRASERYERRRVRRVALLRSRLGREAQKQ
jgi:hypothetical protein